MLNKINLARFDLNLLVVFDVVLAESEGLASQTVGLSRRSVHRPIRPGTLGPDAGREEGDGHEAC